MRIALKTSNAGRNLELSDELLEVLREHRKDALARGHAGTDSFVFCTEDGTPS